MRRASIRFDVSELEHPDFAASPYAEGPVGDGVAMTIEDRLARVLGDTFLAAGAKEIFRSGARNEWFEPR